MAEFGHYTRSELLHLAECAAQMADAVATAVEAGEGDAIALAAGMAQISSPHICHIRAAIIMMASMMLREDRCTVEWRESVPELVAFISGAEAS